MRLKISLILVLLTNITLFAQVKIGDNPSDINPTSILELESTDKVFVLTRMDNTVMQSLLLSSDPNKRPLQGALVYNTTDNCVFMYNGTAWVSLCNLATNSIKVTPLADNPPTTNNNLGDFWINTTTNQTSIYNGTAWVLLNENPKKGTGVPTNTTAPNSVAGDIYVDTATGTIYAHNGTAWVTQTSTTVTANNGLNINTTTNAVELGGALTKPTTITTDATNTLTIEGLQDGNATTDKVVTVDANGVLRKVTLANIAVRQEETLLTAATLNQVEFLVTLKTEDKINVYRNGVRVGFTVNTAKTGITLEPDAKCYTGDQIRIVQIY
ncbi:hypothetical protein [Tenacibaculum dicentrarchi]|uniref:hypothetical protein n=1 Tax=Tenacibaculum dicentrarchi TaxID=669041 RepID=UPI003516C82F